MRIFKHGNWSNGDVCPICNTAKDTEVVLIGVSGTEDGNNMEAKQFHLGCIELTYFTDKKSIFQKF